uniref:tRNA (guanine(26)-N(2))-dimethyltransferase n=1 Tax=Psilocybe cubensis TaxID=181762 RepID=A0A8H7Y2X7_PSICU
MASNTAVHVPDGFRLHTENTSHILLDANEAFLNPVQEFNRDTSIACIRVWSEELNRTKEERWNKSQQRKAAQKGSSASSKVPAAANIGTDESERTPDISESTEVGGKKHEYRPYKITILEALSATGLRSIRYAKEIPLVKYVIANDLSHGAIEAMKRNISINGLGDGTLQPSSNGASKQKIHLNEGDAWEEKKRVDVVDLDPYGTAAPFIDAAVQCVTDGGLLCVTCTDLSVLATTNYPEKCFSNYGGVPVKAEYCHESALRLVLHTLSTSASRYGRYIEPLLCLSIDFYVRLFVCVRTAPVEVKKALSKNSTFYICTTCQTHYEQPLGRMITKTSTSGHTNYIFKTHPGPLVAGPMWSGRLHDPDFVGKVLAHIEENKSHYGTSSRMKGMLTVAKEELETPFFFTPSKVASFFHCETPSIDDVASALLNAGHRVSRSHACAGSLKTDASHRELHDVFRCWIKTHPVKMENISETSPARRLLAKEPLVEANFDRHPMTPGAQETIRLVRYQENPANWGPAKKAATKPDLKRKRSTEALDEPPAKH